MEFNRDKNEDLTIKSASIRMGGHNGMKSGFMQKIKHA
jgi:hypothetical protein